jgi:hypothetical protein
MLKMSLAGLRLGCLVFAVHSLGVGGMVHAGPRPGLVTPTQRWEIDRLRVNGIPLETRATAVAMDRALLTERLAAIWGAGTDRRDTPGSSSTSPATLTLRRDAERTVIGRQRGRLHEVVSLRDAPSGGTSIVVAVSDLSRPVAKLPRLPFQPPRGLRVVTVIEHDSPGGATTVVLDAADTSSMSSQLRKALEVGGWVVRTDPSAQALWADRRGERLDAVTMRSGHGTRVIVQVSVDAR